MKGHVLYAGHVLNLNRHVWDAGAVAKEDRCHPQAILPSCCEQHGRHSSDGPVRKVTADGALLIAGITAGQYAVSTDLGMSHSLVSVRTAAVDFNSDAAFSWADCEGRL